MSLRPNNLREIIGTWTGSVILPMWNLASSVLRKPSPNSHCCAYEARVCPAKVLHPRLERLAERLSGGALMKLSPGLWQTEHRYLPELMNVAIRFRADPPYSIPGAQAQDLLMVSSKGPWTLPLDLLTTDQSSFMANRYYGFSSFDTDEFQDVSFRLQPNPAPSPGWNRYQRLQQAVARKEACFLLEILAREASPLWQPLVEIHLAMGVDVEEPQFQFWPLRDGQAIHPRGFLRHLQSTPPVAKLTLSTYPRLPTPTARQPINATIRQTPEKKDLDFRAPVVRLVPRAKLRKQRQCR